MKVNNGKLDLKDQKILFELDADCRQTYKQIGKKTGLSPEVVHYRIKNLEKQKMITQYQIVVDLSKLGIMQFKILLSFQNINSKEISEKIEELKKIKEVKWIVSCNGPWDLLISLEAISLEEIDKLKYSVLRLFEDSINEKAISVAITAEVYNRIFLLPNVRHIKKSKTIMSSKNKINLDNTDLSILKKLSDNARKTIIEIAEELSLSERIINYRVKQLIKKEIITGFRIALNYQNLGIIFYKIFIHLRNPQQHRLKSLTDYFSTHRNIIHNVQVLGNWDFEPEFEVHSEEEFNSILTDIKDKFSDIIRKVDIITVSKEHKFVYF